MVCGNAFLMTNDTSHVKEVMSVSKKCCKQSGTSECDHMQSPASLHPDMQLTSN